MKTKKKMSTQSKKTYNIEKFKFKPLLEGILKELAVDMTIRAYLRDKHYEKNKPKK